MRSRKYWNMWKNQHRCLVKRVCVLLTSHFLPLIFCEQKMWGKKATFWCACFAPFTSISKTSETAPKWTWYQIFSVPFFFGDEKNNKWGVRVSEMSANLLIWHGRPATKPTLGDLLPFEFLPSKIPESTFYWAPRDTHWAGNISIGKRNSQQTKVVLNNATLLYLLNFDSVTSLEADG